MIGPNPAGRRSVSPVVRNTFAASGGFAVGSVVNAHALGTLVSAWVAATIAASAIMESRPTCRLEEPCERRLSYCSRPY
jgi:hypothetical protein